MAYPTNSLAVVLEQVDRRMIRLKAYAQSSHDAMASGPVTSTLVFDVFTNLKAHRAAFVSAAATSGIVSYAQAEKNDGTLDVAEEFNSVIAAIDAVTDWISSNFPADGDGYLLSSMLGANGPVDRTFSSSLTSGLRTLLTALIATID